MIDICYTTKLTNNHRDAIEVVHKGNSERISWLMNTIHQSHESVCVISEPWIQYKELIISCWEISDLYRYLMGCERTGRTFVYSESSVSFTERLLLSRSRSVHSSYYLESRGSRSCEVVFALQRKFLMHSEWSIETMHSADPCMIIGLGS